MELILGQRNGPENTKSARHPCAWLHVEDTLRDILRKGPEEIRDNGAESPEVPLRTAPSPVFIGYGYIFHNIHYAIYGSYGRHPQGPGLTCPMPSRFSSGCRK